MIFPLLSDVPPSYDYRRMPFQSRTCGRFEIKHDCTQQIALLSTAQGRTVIPSIVSGLAVKCEAAKPPTGKTISLSEEELHEFEDLCGWLALFRDRATVK